MIHRTFTENVSERCSKFDGIHLVVSARIFPEHFYRPVRGASTCCLTYCALVSTRSALHTHTEPASVGPTERSKVKVIHLNLCPLVKEPHCRSAHLLHALKRDFTVLPAHSRVYPRIEWTIPTFAFSAKAGPHLWTPIERKAELAWVSKQSAQNHYVTAITDSQLLADQAITPHWATEAQGLSIELTISRVASRNANHWAIESPVKLFVR